MSITNRTYTIDEFMRMPDERNGRLIELVHGEIHEKPMPGMRHTRLGLRIQLLLSDFARQNDLGEVFPDGADFVIDPIALTVRKPDVAFLAKEHIPDMNSDDAFPTPPDLAIEILSPHDYDHPGQFRKKIDQYLDANIPLIWVVDVRNRSVMIHRPSSIAPETLGIGDELSGEEVLPGFTLPVATIFEGMA